MQTEGANCSLIIHPSNHPIHLPAGAGTSFPTIHTCIHHLPSTTRTPFPLPLYSFPILLFPTQLSSGIQGCSSSLRHHIIDACHRSDASHASKPVVHVKLHCSVCNLLRGHCSWKPPSLRPFRTSLLSVFLGFSQGSFVGYPIVALSSPLNTTTTYSTHPHLHSQISLHLSRRPLHSLGFEKPFFLTVFTPSRHRVIGFCLPCAFASVVGIWVWSAPAHTLQSACTIIDFCKHAP